MVGLDVRPFAVDDVDDAARLLVDRHRRQRTVEPGLSPAFEDVSAARVAIQALAARPGASGAIAWRGGTVVGYLIRTARAPLWGANVWIEGAGHAVEEPEIVRDLYGFAATEWVAEGATSHYAIVPGTDPTLIDAWFRVGFGQQHVHAIRDVAGPEEVVRPPPGVVIRPTCYRAGPGLGLASGRSSRRLHRAIA